MCKQVKIRIITKRLFFLMIFLIFYFSVNATVRYVKSSPGGLANGSSRANASADLQLMINSSSNGDEVWVAAGNYYPARLANNTATTSIGNRDDAFVLKADLKVYGGFVGGETLLSQRELVDQCR